MVSWAISVLWTVIAWCIWGHVQIVFYTPSPLDTLVVRLLCQWLALGEQCDFGILRLFCLNYLVKHLPSVSYWFSILPKSWMMCFCSIFQMACLHTCFSLGYFLVLGINIIQEAIPGGLQYSSTIIVDKSTPQQCLIQHFSRPHN